MVFSRVRTELLAFAAFLEQSNRRTDEEATH